MSWRLHHPKRKRTVKVHRSMHDFAVEEFRHIPHGIRHTILRPSFWLGLTMGFPLEHMLWEHIWPFYLFTEWAGLCATGVHGCLG
jgi:hypothetical protein